MRTADFHYHLPEDLIAQHPASKRDQSRLLVYRRDQPSTHHTVFNRIAQWLNPGDLLVLNDTKVIPARLHGRRSGHTGHVELLLLREEAEDRWWSMLKPGRRLKPGTRITLVDRNGEDSEFSAIILEKNEEGHGFIQFEGPRPVLDALTDLGETPLPPYIQPDPERLEEDRNRYQTVYARTAGSVAAPTAGLHFTEPLLEQLEMSGIRIARLTLHVGLGTFAPVKCENIQDHRMHREYFSLPRETVDAIEKTRRQGGRVIAVGTTSLRVLESVAARHQGRLVPTVSDTDIFIYPPYRFHIVQGLITNFHLPGSTLLMLISAFLSPDSTGGVAVARILYEKAVEERYRFFSYGDAMLIL